MNDFLFSAAQSPTANRPLLGLTILVVEDSRFACEALRLMCLRSGARIRRADCLKSARRHLKVYRPSVIIVDFGLPDGSGLDLIDELQSTNPRVEVLLATSGDEFNEATAIAAGADGFLHKPFASIATFQELILSHLPDVRRPKGPRLLVDDTVVPDPLAYRDDMAHVVDILEENRSEAVADYIAQFVTGVARSADDHSLEEAALDLARECAEGRPSHASLARIAGMAQSRLTERVAL